MRVYASFYAMSRAIPASLCRDPATDEERDIAMYLGSHCIAGNCVQTLPRVLGTLLLFSFWLALLISKTYFLVWLLLLLYFRGGSEEIDIAIYLFVKEGAIALLAAIGVAVSLPALLRKLILRRFTRSLEERGLGWAAFFNPYYGPNIGFLTPRRTLKILFFDIKEVEQTKYGQDASKAAK